MKCIFAMMIPDKTKMKEEVYFYLVYLAGIIVLYGLTTYFGVYAFGLVSENITEKIRYDLYKGFIRKEQGWFDIRENSPGILTGVLAEDALQIHSVGSEKIGNVLASLSSLIGGIGIALYYDWRITLTATAMTPLLMSAGAINGRIKHKLDGDDQDAFKQANLLTADSIINYRTVQSFGSKDFIIKTLNDHLMIPSKINIKDAHCIGFLFGFSQFAKNVFPGILYFVGAHIQKANPDLNPGDMFTAIFAVMYAAIGAANANEYGPDV